MSMRNEQCNKVCRILDDVLANRPTERDALIVAVRTAFRTAFDELEECKTGRWIPCSERLPEEDDYRSCYEYDDGVVWWVNDIGQMGLGWYYSSTGTWAYYDEINGCEKRVGNVIAWTQLPEPYEERGTDERSD